MIFRGPMHVNLRLVTMRSAGDANISDMAALLDHADSDGLPRAFRRTYVFRRAGGDVRRVQLWNQRETASRRHPMARARLGATSFELDDSRCVEVTQRAVLSRAGGVASAKQRVTLPEKEEWL